MEVDKHLEDLEKRMKAVEYSVFKTEDPDTRFSEIYDKLSKVQSKHAEDLEETRDIKTDM